MQKVLFLISLFLVIGNFSSAQDTLQIGIKEAPPFVVWQSGEPTGLSIDFWELVNQDLNYPYTYVQYDDLGELLKAVESGEVDMSINPITVSEERMESIAFSQPFFITETTYAKRKESTVIAFLNSIFSWDFLSALAVLLLVILAFGLLVWLFERRKNPDEFQSSWKGVADGFWWSAVTMTTVGYGDKSPRSLGGRVVGFIWMFTAIVLISGLTAGIASALTVYSISNKISNVNDLKNFDVITVDKSSAEEFLKQYQVPHKSVASLEDALRQVKAGKQDVVVYDRPILKNEITQLNLEDDLVMAEKGLKTDYYSLSFPQGSPYFQEVDRATVRKLESLEWQVTQHTY